MAPRLKKIMQFNPSAPFRPFLVLSSERIPSTSNSTKKWRHQNDQKSREKVANIFGHFVKLPFEHPKIAKISKITKISKLSERHENIYSVIFIVDFEYALTIDKNFAIYPVSANSSIFCTFARTHPITLKLYPNIEDVIFIENREKNLQYLWPLVFLRFKIRFCKFWFSRNFGIFPITIWYRLDDWFAFPNW